MFSRSPRPGPWRLALVLALALAQPVLAREARHPSQMMTEAAKTFAAGDRDGGVYQFYRAQLRWRARLQADPDPSGEGAAFGAMFETLGPPINEWAFGDIPALAAIIDRVLADDAADPDPTIPAGAYAESRAGLARLRDQMLAEQDSMRAQRAANGLANR